MGALDNLKILIFACETMRHKDDRHKLATQSKILDSCYPDKKNRERFRGWFVLGSFGKVSFNHHLNNREKPISL